MLTRLIHHLFVSAAALLFVTGCLVVTMAIREMNARQAYEQQMANVEIIAPAGFPEQNQETIDIAMTMYSIERSSTVDGPDFDPALSDRGLTTGGLILPQKRVTIGPAAFTSWGVLGSTLAHEIEVHVPQSFFKVVATDQWMQWSLTARRIAGKVFPALAPGPKELFENDGTWAAERAAYLHEIRNAKRFGLSQEELGSIWRVMDYYYPSEKKGESSHLSASSQKNHEEPNSSEDIRASDL
ncbi:MAG: hypothetical protein ACO3A4_14190 [Silvanigrellaceae bacterium]